jgi:hypothetical protein
VAYEGVSLLDLSGPLEALRIASIHPNHVGASRLYDYTVVSVRGGLVISGDGVSTVTKPATVLDGRTIDTLIVFGACNYFCLSDALGDLRFHGGKPIGQLPATPMRLTRTCASAGSMSSRSRASFAIKCIGNPRKR